MLFGLFTFVAIIALVVFALRRGRREQSALSTGHQVRLFFIYVILLVSALVATAGLAGSIGPIVDRAAFVAADADQTALNLAMVILGVPLTALLAVMTRRRLARDRSELQSIGYSLFVTVGTVAPLVVAMFGGYQTMLWLLRAERYDGYAVSQLVVWGITWFVIRRIDRVLVTGPRTALRHLVPTLIGLSVAAVALGQIVAGLVQRAFDASAESVFVPMTTQLHRGLALLVVGAVVWTVEWLRGLSHESDSDAWRFVVVLFGVAGGLVATIVSVAIVGYHVAVWLVGSPESQVARTHFDSLPEAVGGMVAGGLTWWYHRTLLAQRRGTTRNEIDRVYEHVMAAGGLLSSAVGVVILLVALIEAITGTTLIRGDTAINTLLLACTLLIIGVPVWWTYWRTTLRREGAEERGSFTRRMYVVLVLGIGGLVALGTAIATVYLFLRDVIEGQVGSSTARALRYPLAILITSGSVAAYHVSVFRGTVLRTGHAAIAERRRVVVAGPMNAALDTALRSTPELDVEWVVGGQGDWPVDGVVERVQRVTRAGNDVVVVLTPTGVEVGRL
jgi:hypothetical protein